MTQEQREKIRNILYTNKCITDYREEDPFVGIYFSDLIDLLEDYKLCLIDAEMNDPVLGKLLNRNAAYILGKEIKLLFIDKACKWLNENFRVSSFDNTKIITHFSSMFDVLDSFRKAMKGGEE